MFVIVIWQTVKSMPQGTNFEGNVFYIQDRDIEFLYDLTSDGKSEQEIYDEMIGLINGARDYILIDMFLFNSFTNTSEKPHRNISSEVAKKLVDKINQYPDIKIDFITDNINTTYGGSKNAELNMLKSAGVNVIITDLNKLRDSNPIYSSVWRTLFQWFGNSNRPGFFSHPFSNKEPKVSLRTYLNLLNFKANHRKVMIADSKGEMMSILTSANMHDGSSAHSNVAIKVKGNFWRDVYTSEFAVAQFSGRKLSEVPEKYITKKEQVETKMSIKLLTENKIKKVLLHEIKNTKVGDQINIAMFYLSDRNVIKHLIMASNKGVEVRIVLDPNKDAFGREKGGIPNRQVAKELIRKTNEGIKLKWYDTSGEQFHSKMVWINKKAEDSVVLLGSANLTKRNLENYNLESNILLKANQNTKVMTEVKDYFEKIWENNDKRYTVDYDKYQDDSIFKIILYRFSDFSGMCTY